MFPGENSVLLFSRGYLTERVRSSGYALGRCSWIQKRCPFSNYY
ncbi:hypothetical protein ACQCVP_14505 [Rossellomorea vietnamensis]